jgi:Cu2+-exporting ATPase
MEMRPRRCFERDPCAADLAPPMATVVRDGKFTEIPTSDAADDMVLIRPGDKLPVDGESSTASPQLMNR